MNIWANFCMLKANVLKKLGIHWVNNVSSCQNYSRFSCSALKLTNRASSCHWLATDDCLFRCFSRLRRPLSFTLSDWKSEWWCSNFSDKTETNGHKEIEKCSARCEGGDGGNCFLNVGSAWKNKLWTRDGARLRTHSIDVSSRISAFRIQISHNCLLCILDHQCRQHK